MSRRRLSTIGAFAIVALIAACDSSPTPSPVGTGQALASPSPHASGAASAAPATSDPSVPEAPTQPTVFDGLYTNADVSVSGDDMVAVVRTGMTCPALEHMIGASAWTIAGRETQASSSAAGQVLLTILTLTNGDQTALAYLAGGDSCTARIARTSRAPLQISGAASFDGTADVDVPFCLASGEKVSIAASFRTPQGPNVQVNLVAPVRAGTARLAADDVTVSMSRGHMSVSKLAGVIIGAFKNLDGGKFGDAYEATDDSRARLVVESVDPFVGTLNLTDYEGADGTISIEGQVACHLPGGALRRAAALAAVPAATTPPGTVGPTLPPFDGAAPGTAVVTGSAIAGTYQLPASDLDCYFDFDEGAWTILSLGGADPTFYLYVFTGEGGGSTDQVSMGLIVGDGGNGHLLLLDTRAASGDTALATVATTGGLMSVAVKAHSSSGATLAANLSCPVQ